MHNDATGRPITKGSYIAYVVTTGSRAGIKFGAVTKLNEKKKKMNVFNHTTRTYEHVTETDYSVQIIAAEKPHWGPDKDKWIVQGKKEGQPARVQAVTRMDRIVLLDANQMHPEAKEVLDQELHFRGLL